MDSKKLYYADSHIKVFSATVLTCDKTERGYAVVLDATAFYPEGGGQACDQGTLNGTEVTDVQEKKGRVVHFCAEPLVPGTVVRGEIDWNRRFDLMQQHTGEHIVSGIIHKKYGWHNVGFHMGSEMITIDFDGQIPPEDLHWIEDEANRRVWENIAVQCGYPEEAELAHIPYRTKKRLPWPVRIVEIPDVDLCACCGTHVSATGEIGLIKLFSCVKFHQGVRIEMACGARALRLLSSTYEQNRQVSQAFSAKIMETGAAARKMNEILAEEKYRCAALQKQIFGYTARQYRGKGDVVHFEKELQPGQVWELAEMIAGECTGVAAVFSQAADRWDVCLARPGADVKEMGSRMAKALNGRGGGKPGFFQGSVKCTKEEIETFFR